MRYLLLLCTLFVLQSTWAQTPLEHKAKIYKDSLNRIYQQASQPVYLFISTSPDKTDAIKLESEHNAKETNPMYFDGHGKHFVQHQDVVDQKDILFEIYADGIAPESNILLRESSYYEVSGKYFFEPGLKVTLSSTDEMSGSEGIYLSINKEAFKKYEQELLLQEEGEYELSYYSVDHVGNVEKIQRSAFVIDATAPATELTVKGDQFEQYLSSKSQLMLTAQDKLAGVASIRYSIDDQTEKVYRKAISLERLEEGEHVITYYATDHLNNKEDKKEFRFFIDKQAPVVSKQILGSKFEVNGKTYFSKDTRMQLSAHDEAAGVKSIFYSINDADYQLYEAPISMQNEEAKMVTIKAYAVDKVNNKSSHSKDELSQKDEIVASGEMDFDGPELSYHFDGPVFQSRDSIFIGPKTKVKLTADDKGSGVSDLIYRINGDNEESYSEPIQLNKEGVHQISISGFDNLLNQSDADFSIIVDTEGPEIIPTLSIDPIGKKEVNGQLIEVYPAHVMLFLSATDHITGVESVAYQLNEQKEMPYAGMIKNFEKGMVYQVTIKTKDQLGNMSESTFQFAIEGDAAVFTKK